MLPARCYPGAAFLISAIRDGGLPFIGCIVVYTQQFLPNCLTEQEEGQL